MKDYSVQEIMDAVKANLERRGHIRDGQATQKGIDHVLAQIRAWKATRPN